ncbi:MAG: ATP-dependent Clp protease ATP-binding subunit [Anaerolineales bacterium]|nr:ATP-dependent Clp protease ATP-binding subunit [Anaerolineales bacterium]
MKNIKDIITYQYPYPLAVAAKRFNDSISHTERFLSLATLIEFTIKYIASIAIGQYLRDEQNVPALQAILKRNLARPTLGMWNELMRECIQYYQEHPDRDFAIPKLKRKFNEKFHIDDRSSAPIVKGFRFMEKFLRPGKESNKSSITLPQFFDLVVFYRNKTWGHGIDRMNQDACEQHISVMLPAIEQILTELDFLLQYPLRYVHEARMEKGKCVHTMFLYMGAQYEKDKKDFVGDYHQEHRLYLCNDDGVPLLSLHPLLIIQRRNMFMMEFNDRNQKVTYRSVDSGDEFEPTDIDSYRITRLTDTHNKLDGVDLPVPKEDEPEEELPEDQPAEDEPEEPPELVEPPPPPAGKKEPPEPAPTGPIPAEEPPITQASLPAELQELLLKLDGDARSAVEMGLGEALRLGQHFLGLEFLLMGLSRVPGALREALENARLDPGHLRGALRGLTGIRYKDWRHLTRVPEIGAQALQYLQTSDSRKVIDKYTHDQEGEFAAQLENPSQADLQVFITPRLHKVLQTAVAQAGQGAITTHHLIWACLQEEQSPAVLFALQEFSEAGLDPNQLIALAEQRLAEGSGEQPGQQPLPGRPPPQVQQKPPEEKGARPDSPLAPRGLLAQCGRNLTELARSGNINPAVGEAAGQAMYQIGLILQQTQANNPILLGDSGVGKTAIIEGFAWRLAVGEQHGQPVAPQLASKRVIDLSPNALMAGTRYRGDLEERLQALLREVREARGQVIVFIDEIHTILGGRSEGGLGTMADSLKPALARGEFPCIGATTVGEYRRHIESDPALARRFTPVWIEEPALDDAIQIVQTVAEKRLGPAHNVLYPTEVVREAVMLSVRYLHDEFLPGKAIKLLDQAGPRLVMGGSLRGVRPKQAEAAPVDKTQPLPYGEVTVDLVRAIVSERTGVPLSSLSRDDRQRLLDMEKYLMLRIKGQDEPVRHVARVIKRARAGLGNPRKPLGVFLFAGPTGVGKTEMALAMAEALFDDDKAIFRLDMSEFMEKHQVSRLIGSPPGYVGYEEEGQLTGRLRRRPYSVILLDEMEKAHPDVQNLFLQLFDAGRLTDSHGNLADGRNAIFIMTTNLGAKVPMGFQRPQMANFTQQIKSAIESHFSPEFLNRLDRIIIFEPLSDDAMLAIFDKLFLDVQARLKSQGVEIEADEEFKRDLCRRNADHQRGARDLQRAIEDEIVAPLTDQLLAGELPAGARVVIGTGGQITVQKSKKRSAQQARPAPESGTDPDAPADPSAPTPQKRTRGKK